MTSEIRTNTITSRAGLSTVTFTDSGPMFSGITTFVDNSTFSVGTGGTIHAPATNVMALGTNSIDAIKIDSSGNVNVTGILTASSISGGVSLTNGSNDRLVTATGASGLNGESNLTFDGSTLGITKSSDGSILQTRRTGNTSGGGAELKVTDGFSSTSPVYSFWYNNTTGIGNPAANTISFINGGSERLRIASGGDIYTSSGRLFLGGNGSPTNLAGVQYSKLLVDVANNADYVHFRKNLGQNQPILNITHNQDYMAAIRYANSGDAWASGILSDGSYFFSYGMGATGGGATERLRIASDGDVTMNNSTTANFFTGAAVNIISDKNVETGVDDMANYHLVLKNPANDTGEAIGLAFGITDTGTKVGAAIVHERDAAGSQGSLKFFTRPSNAGPPVERLRITADGQTQLTISSNGNVTTPLRLWNGGYQAGANVQMLFYNGDGSTNGVGALARIVAVDEGNYDSSLMFETANKSGQSESTTAHMKLTKDGRLGIGQVSLNSIESKLHIETSGTSSTDGITFKSGSGSTGAKFFFATTNSDRSKYIQHSGYWLELGCHPNEGVRFRDGINNVVRFYMNGSNGSYYFAGSNLSDRNLKENIETISTPTIDLIKQVIPKTFNWKIDNNNTPHGGFIAQEMQPLFPKLVSGTDYDESRADSTEGCNPTGMAFDYNGYTAYLTKAMQELIAKVETLEQENIALKERVMRLEG